MKSSSFLCGALFGITAALWASRRKSSLISAMNGAAGSLKISGIRDVLDNVTNGDEHASNQGESAAKSTSNADHNTHNKVHPSSGSGQNHSKEYNLKQITDFIKGNPDVRREVESILKETHATIPGL